VKEATKVVNQIPNVVIAVTGGISAYKIVEVVRILKKENFKVQVVATESALKFVGEATWSAISGQEVISSIWDDTKNVSHVQLAKNADLVVVAPATADTISDLAQAKANNAVSALVLTTTAPVMVFPAMHTQMWEHPGTVQNIETLIKRNLMVFSPDKGALTSGDEGVGRLPAPSEIANLAINHFSAKVKPRILISTGGTKEFLDPVRYLTNTSSGKQGLALAQSCIARGYETTLVSTKKFYGNWNLIEVTSADEMLTAMKQEMANHDIIIMAAAVSDWTTKEKKITKIKKSESNWNLELVATSDILTELSKLAKPSQVLVGFAAETAPEVGALIAMAQEKLHRKKLDLICANDVSGGKVFDQDSTHLFLIQQNSVNDIGEMSKLAAAAKVLDQAVQIFISK
jgi:phosphopantothenoylcysteine decarboxylase / phosphopantothenate---cysteine ligase